MTLVFTALKIIGYNFMITFLVIAKLSEKMIVIFEKTLKNH